ncbi:PfkB family carbohydrate kinase [Mycobacterium sp. SA01]|uniref:PfkB family carbohydrate kinase n=1 Tax=Mycobacterium sp. SA01 TaxID=3238820 RepID=UPI00351ABECA
MVETSAVVKADTLVIDPQHSPVEVVLQAATGKRRALVLNEHEARNFTRATSSEEAALALLDRGIDAAIVKCGALGAVVAHQGVVQNVGVIPTATVHPIGSGDAFSAGFCHAWSGGDDPVAAASFGSRLAAAHSILGTPQVTPGTMKQLEAPLPFLAGATPRIYLAGPFFSVAERHLVRTVRRALRNIGAEVFSPLDEIGPGGDEVAKQDLQGLTGCHSVLALLDGADPGTVFEIGWATHAGIPVIGFAELPDDHAWTMARGTGSVITNDLSSALYQSVWAAVVESQSS